MATAPYGVRLLVGAAAIAIEETIKLPKTILMYPMTVASTAAHVVMKLQQDLAELVIKGDSTLEHIFPPKDEQPEWATFDEDLRRRPRRQCHGAPKPQTLSVAARGGSRCTPPPMPAAGDDGRRRRTAGKQAAPAPAVVEELDYESADAGAAAGPVAVAELDELEALLAYEDATKGRAPFQTLLANRITRATAK